MSLTKNELKFLFEKDYKKNNDIAERFGKIGEIVNKFLKLGINKQYIKEFGPESDELLGGNNSEENRINMKEHVDLIDELWFLIGGFDGKKVHAKYRIISATTSKIMI